MFADDHSASNIASNMFLKSMSQIRQVSNIHSLWFSLNKIWANDQKHLKKCFTKISMF